MVIDFSQPIIGMNGKPIPRDKESNESTTLEFACREALLATIQGEQNVSGEEKFKRWELAKKIHGKVDLKAEEVTKIKELVGKLFPAGILGPVYEMLENTPR